MRDYEKEFKDKIANLVKIKEEKFQQSNKREKSKLVTLLFLQIAIVLWMSIVHHVDLYMLIGAWGYQATVYSTYGFVTCFLALILNGVNSRNQTKY